MLSNKSLENAAEFKYLVMRLTNQNCSHEEIKIRLDSTEDLLASHSLSKNTRIKYTGRQFCALFSINVNLVCDIKEGIQARMFDSRVMRNTFGRIREEVTGG